MSERYEHILTPLDAQITVSKRNLARYTREDWTECIAEEQERLTELELLYDIVHEGLLDVLKVDYTAVQLALAGVPA